MRLVTCLIAQLAHQHNASIANLDTFRNPGLAPSVIQSSCFLNSASLVAPQHVLPVLQKLISSLELALLVATVTVRIVFSVQMRYVPSVLLDM